MNKKAEVYLALAVSAASIIGGLIAFANFADRGIRAATKEPAKPQTAPVVYEDTSRDKVF